VEAAISRAIKLEAFKQLLSLQGYTVDHVDSRAKCQPCTVCAVADPQVEVQNDLAQVKRVMEALATELWSDFATPHDAAPYISSISDAVLMLPASAPGKMPRINQVVEVAVDVGIACIQGRWICAGSVDS